MNLEKKLFESSEDSILSPKEQEALKEFNKTSPIKATAGEFIEIKKQMEEENRGNKETQPEKSREGGMSRRKFLKWALGAGAAATAGAIGIERVVNRLTELTESKEEKTALSGVKTGEEEKIDKYEKIQVGKIENIADHYLDAYNKIGFSGEKFPGNLFEKDLLIAQQCQESRGKIDAKSHSGAIGVMQNMTSSIVDVTNYLNKLERNTDFEWSGPKNLSKEQVGEIKKLLAQKSNYSRVFGKIYLMQLWDNKYGYGVGRKKYGNGDIKGGQIELMGAYNAGHRRVKNKDFSEWKKLRDKYKNSKTKDERRLFRAYNEAITYVERIYNYKKRLENIRKKARGMDIVFDDNEDYAVREIALKLDEVTGVKGEDRKKKLASETNKYLDISKKININEGRGPSYKEIDKCLVVKR